jgi:hypothetical protein
MMGVRGEGREHRERWGGFFSLAVNSNNVLD